MGEGDQFVVITNQIVNRILQVPQIRLSFQVIEVDISSKNRGGAMKEGLSGITSSKQTVN
jgi:hypothetical protein